MAVLTEDHRTALKLLALAIGLVFAFQIPGFLAQRERSRQKTSYFRVYEWMQTVDRYAGAHHAMPRPGYFGPISGIAAQLGNSKLNPRDGWNNPIIYHASTHHYAIWATGSDGRLSEPVPRGEIFGLESDTIASDGEIMQWAAGTIALPPDLHDALPHPDRAFADFLLRGPNTAECRGCHKAWLEGN
ncbi:MAG: hypothetical protein QOI24_106 [Acidobacteriota bacterium]|nr:hypothetical protein [Acidobacteriota bacterium]